MTHIQKKLVCLRTYYDVPDAYSFKGSWRWRHLKFSSRLDYIIGYKYGDVTQEADFTSTHQFWPWQWTIVMILNYEWKIYTEHPRWCIHHKDLEYLQSQHTHTLMNTCIKHGLVSAPSLGHHQTLLIRESEYNRATKNYEAGDLPLHDF
jgi:hypothetical protein